MTNHQTYMTKKSPSPIFSNPVFVKQICLFSAKSPRRAIRLTRGVNFVFQESMIVYRGFLEALINLLHMHQHALQDLFTVVYAKRFSLARWICIELEDMPSNFTPPQAEGFNIIQHLVIGKHEDEIIECIKVLAERKPASAMVEMFSKQFDFHDLLFSRTITTNSVNFLIRLGKTKVIEFLFGNNNIDDINNSAKGILQSTRLLLIPDDRGCDAVYFAITGYQMKMARLLFDADNSKGGRADFTHMNRVGTLKQTPLMLALLHYPHCPQIAEFLVKKLLSIPISSSHSSVSQIRAQCQREVCARDSRGWTVLHYATSVNAQEIIVDLVTKFGADVNTVSAADGLSPFAIALRKQHFQLVGFFAFAGANISAIAQSLHVNAVSPKGDDHLKLLKTLVRTCGVFWLREIRDPNTKQTLLHKAVMASSTVASSSTLDTIRFLIYACCCNVNDRDSAGNTPLHLVMIRDAALMMSSSSSFSLPSSSLHTMKIAKFLISNGASKSLNQKNTQGETPLSILEQERNTVTDTNFRRSQQYQSLKNYLTVVSKSPPPPTLFSLKQEIMILLISMIPNVRPLRPCPEERTKEICDAALFAKKHWQRYDAESFKTFASVHQRRSYIKANLHASSVESGSLKAESCTQVVATTPPSGKIPVAVLHDFHLREIKKIESSVKLISLMKKREALLKKTILDFLSCFDEIERKMNQVEQAIRERKCLLCVGCYQLFKSRNQLLLHSSSKACNKISSSCVVQ